ncbi:MAG: hypothetical protein WC635_08545 [Bacteriovorax sp.]|jgi:hypothetical protein
MQELILVISRCVSLRKAIKGEKLYYRFHFKGYYSGQKIKSIHLFPAEFNIEKQQLSKGDDYLLWVKRKEVKGEILEVELIAFKKIT